MGRVVSGARGARYRGGVHGRIHLSLFWRDDRGLPQCVGGTGHGAHLDRVGAGHEGTGSVSRPPADRPRYAEGDHGPRMDLPGGWHLRPGLERVPLVALLLLRLTPAAVVSSKNPFGISPLRNGSINESSRSGWVMTAV